MQNNQLLNDEQFISWVDGKFKNNVDLQDEKTLERLWNDYQREVEYTKTLGF